MIGLPNDIYVSEYEARRMMDQFSNPSSCPWERTDRAWTDPTEGEPSIDKLEVWMSGGVFRATDGCDVEPDGVCLHYESCFDDLMLLYLSSL
jgi:hypothetical protein